MTTSTAIPVARKNNSLLTALGVALIIFAFFCHFFAARAIGGTYVDFRDHIAGFFMILVVTGVIIAGLGWRFWKGRRDITLLIIGVVQAVFGIVIYLQRYHLHG